MALPDHITVLIIGAGPTGLAAALSLLHHGFHDFLIVDAQPQGENISRAVIIHAATLEVCHLHCSTSSCLSHAQALDTIGCGDDIVSQGIKSTSFNIGSRSTSLATPHIESLASYTRHPYILVVTQNVAERTLEKKLASLGVNIHRPLKVVRLNRNAESSLLTDVTFEDGSVITTAYVIGADGARSVVRTSALIALLHHFTTCRSVLWLG